MKFLKNVAFAAAIAVSVGFIGACAEGVPPTTTTTEYSTTTPAVYVAPPVTTSGTMTTTTQYPNGTVTSTTPVYSSVETSPPVVMVPTAIVAVVMAPVLVEQPLPRVGEMGLPCRRERQQLSMVRYRSKPRYVEWKWGHTVSEHHDHHDESILIKAV